MVFAGLLLERKGKPFRAALEAAAREAIMVWVIVLGQVALGLLATALILKPWFGVHFGVASLIETGFAGGHGTAAAMGDVFASPAVAFADGRDLGMFMATAGLVFGIVSGMLYVNLAVHLGVDTYRSGTDSPLAQPKPVIRSERSAGRSSATRSSIRSSFKH